MKKILIVLVLIAVFISSASFLAFTSGGNALLLPFINSYLKKSVEGAKIELLRLELKPGYLNASAKVNDAIDVDAEGPIDLLAQRIDLDYTIEAEKIISQEVTIDEAIQVSGEAKGKLEEMQITGNGKAFASDIHYDFNLHENQPKNIKLDLRDASIAGMLAIAGTKPYADGRMSIHVDMPELDPDNPQGEAHLKVKEAVIDAAVLKQEHNISLVSEQLFSADITATAKGEMLLGQGDINTSMGKVSVSETSYHLGEQRLDTDYLLHIPDLAKLKTLAGSPLEGDLQVAGKASYQDEKVHVSGVTHSFGGESEFLYDNDTLKAILTEAETAKLLKLLGQPAYAEGKLSANVILDSVRDLSGRFDLKSSGRAESATVKKELGANVGKQFDYDAIVNGEIKNRKAHTQVKINTTMGKLDMPDMIYGMADGTLQSSYHLYIPDLSKLQPLTERRFRGDMDFRGKLTKAEDFVVTGRGKEFDGSVAYKLVNDRIKADVHGATVSKVMYMLGYPQVLEALSEAKVEYNFTTKNGTVDAKLDRARILSSQLTILLKQLTGIDLTKELYNQATFVSTLTPSKIHFDFIAQNIISHFKIKNGILDKRNERINAAVDMRYKEKDLKARITGTVKNPKVSIDASEYLKSKVEKKVDKLIEKKFKDKGEGQIKGLLKGFLK
ncbi:MAG: hypothetical protein ABXS92_07360 [Sulfurimonas sp.]